MPRTSSRTHTNPASTSTRFWPRSCERAQVVLAVGDVLEHGAEAARPVGAVDVGRELDAVAHRDADVALDDDPPGGRARCVRRPGAGAHTPSRGIRSFQRRSANGSPSALTRRRRSTTNSRRRCPEPRLGAVRPHRGRAGAGGSGRCPRPRRRQRVVVARHRPPQRRTRSPTSPRPGSRRGRASVVTMPARPVSTSVTHPPLRARRRRRRPAGRSPPSGRRPASNGAASAGRPGSSSSTGDGDLERRDHRQRPQVGPVADRHRDPDPVARREPPAGGHQRQLERGLAGDLEVHRRARDRLRRAVRGDVLELAPTPACAGRDGAGRSARPARRTPHRLRQRLAVEGRAERVVAALVEELAGRRRRRAPLAGHDPGGHAGRAPPPARPA